MLCGKNLSKLKIHTKAPEFCNLFTKRQVTQPQYVHGKRDLKKSPESWLHIRHLIVLPVFLFATSIFYSFFPLFRFWFVFNRKNIEFPFFHIVFNRLIFQNPIVGEFRYLLNYSADSIAKNSSLHMVWVSQMVNLIHHSQVLLLFFSLLQAYFPESCCWWVLVPPKSDSKDSITNSPSSHRMRVGQVEQTVYNSNQPYRGNLGANPQLYKSSKFHLGGRTQPKSKLHTSPNKILTFNKV